MFPVFLIHYHAPDWCRRSVEALRKSSVPLDITVIDNGGLDQSIEGARVVSTVANGGYSGGANEAISRWLVGVEPYALIASHDLVVEPTTIESLIHALDVHPDFGIAAPVFTPHRYGGPEIGSDGQMIEIEWVSGGAMVVRRACIEVIGPLDEQFGSYVEDVDLSYRARDAGWRVGLARHASAAALGSATPGGARTTAIESNWIYLHAKRGDWRSAARRLFMQLIHAVRHPSIAPRYLRAFGRAIHLLWVLKRRSGHDGVLLGRQVLNE